jgi:hypothetical protein
MENRDSHVGVEGLRAKWTYVTRTVPENTRLSLGPQVGPRRAGDLIVARVVKLGAHEHAEDRHGRRMRLYPGDLVVGAYGNRYATDFYEGYVPAPGESITHLLTAGGLVGSVASAHEAHPDPTELEVIGGFVMNEDHPISLEEFARPAPPQAIYRPPVPTMVVVGTSMNAGKTTTAAGIIRGLSRSGLRVGAGKVTGSGSGKDRWSYADAGAHALLDFLDFGMVSTFGYPPERLAWTMRAIRDTLIDEGSDAVVLEIADGLLQQETRWLLERRPIEETAVIFAATDALSAHSGVEILRALDLRVRAISGLVSRSPLAAREAETATGLPVISPWSLAEGAVLELLAGEPVLG